MNMPRVYDFTAKRLAGSDERLSTYNGRVLLIVNTASKCGFTPQFRQLEQMHADYARRGFAVLGFPCNQFLNQEPGDADQIRTFCQQDYGVTFPMFEKIDVNGPGTHPLFGWLKQEAPGILGSLAVKWNFTKFLVNRAGRAVVRYAPTMAPENIRPTIERLLNEDASSSP